MTNIIELFEKEEPSDVLFGALWAKIGIAAIKARDGTVEDRADVMLAGTMAFGRALAIMCNGKRDAIKLMLPIAQQTLADAADDGAAILSIAEEFVR